jgi:tubulin polyglutamylase TTLL9
MNPLLIGGKKFDMRIYVLVTSYQPLTVYLYRSGFGRFTHHRYSNKVEEIQNTFMHLTNVAIQKTADNYDDRLGGKWDLRSMKMFLISKYGSERVSDSFGKIQDMIIRSL